MYKFSALIIGMCVLISACSSTFNSSAPNYRKVSDSEIPDHNDVISVYISTKYSQKWLQPTNKSEQCEMFVEGYIAFNIDDLDVEWDGRCKNGKAEGLGKMISTVGSVSLHEITYQNRGVNGPLFYGWFKGDAQIGFGSYVRENNKRVKDLLNIVTLKPNGDMGSVLFTGEFNRRTTIIKGVSFKKHPDGEVKYTGKFGTDLFYGTRELFDTQSKLKSTEWGYYNTTRDYPDHFVILQNNTGLWHQKYQSGRLKEDVQLPKSYIKSVKKVASEATESGDLARSAGQQAIAMKKKYDAMH